MVVGENCEERPTGNGGGVEGAVERGTNKREVTGRGDLDWEWEVECHGLGGCVSGWLPGWLGHSLGRRPEPWWEELVRAWLWIVKDLAGLRWGTKGRCFRRDDGDDEDYECWCLIFKGQTIFIYFYRGPYSYSYNLRPTAYSLQPTGTVAEDDL
jgi:hypothetical protein